MADEKQSSIDAKGCRCARWREGVEAHGVGILEHLRDPRREIKVAGIMADDHVSLTIAVRRCRNGSA